MELALDRVSQGRPEPCNYRSPGSAGSSPKRSQSRFLQKEHAADVGWVVPGPGTVFPDPAEPYRERPRPAEPAPAVRILPLDLVAEVFDRVAHLPACRPEALLHVARGLVCHAFAVQIGVIGQIAGRLLDLALDLVALAFEFVAVHGP